jgi:uncharacterized protein (TIGR02301 family)
VSGLPARLAVLAVLAAQPAQAQQRAAPAAPAPAPPPVEQPVPYEPELLRLSEVIGILTFMTALCRVADDGAWRRRMAALLELEGQTDGRKERLAGAFNRGYQTYQYAHNSCTDSARLIIERSLGEGERLSRHLTTRFSG